MSITLEDSYADTIEFDIDDDSLTIRVNEGDETCEVYWTETDARDAAATIAAALDKLQPVRVGVANSANEAKLRVAAEYELRAKFAYQGEDDNRAYARRLVVETVWTDASGHLLVGGESYDEDGDNEGYRQFRLDRISGPVVVR